MTTSKCAAAFRAAAKHATARVGCRAAVAVPESALGAKSALAIVSEISADGVALAATRATTAALSTALALALALVIAEAGVVHVHRARNIAELSPTAATSSVAVLLMLMLLRPDGGLMLLLRPVMRPEDWVMLRLRPGLED